MPRSEERRVFGSSHYLGQRIRGRGDAPLKHRVAVILKILLLLTQEVAASPALCEVQSDSLNHLARNQAGSHKRTVILEGDPAAIKQEVGVRAEQQAVASIDALVAI